MKGRLAIVKWGDAWGSAGWQHRDYLMSKDAGEPSEVMTVGWIIQDNKEGLLLACCLSGAGASPLHQFVPRGMLRKIIYIGKKYDFSLN